MRHSWDALCWAVIITGLLIACSKKPKSTPSPAPEKDNGSVETAIADGGRGWTLEDMGMQKSRVVSVEFTPVYFGLNSAALKPQDVLHTLVDEVPSYRACHIQGHACPLGSTEYNLALGHHRAQSVVNYLRSAGVRTGFRITSYGEERPETHEPADYAVNRRVVVECEK